MSDINKFVSNSDLTFETMLQKISSFAKVSPTLLRKYGIKSFEDWELKTGLSIEHLCEMHAGDRCNHIYDILTGFRHNLETVVFSVKDLDKSLSIANIAYEIMFSK